MDIHKYDPDTSSSQLGIKSLSTRVPRANGHGSRSCIVVCASMCKFRGRNFFKGGNNVQPKKNSIFLKNGKTVISVENQKFSRSRMMKWTSPLNSSHEI